MAGDILERTDMKCFPLSVTEPIKGPALRAIHTGTSIYTRHIDKRIFLCLPEGYSERRVHIKDAEAKLSSVLEIKIKNKIDLQRTRDEHPSLSFTYFGKRQRYEIVLLNYQPIESHSPRWRGFLMRLSGSKH